MENKIAEAVFEHKITRDLILNIDQRFLGFARRLKTTYTKRNSDDKHITGTCAVNLSMEFLPMQLIYTWTTDFSHPHVKFSSEVDTTHSHNHQSNEKLVISLLKKILIPFIQTWKKTHEVLKLGEDSKSLLRFDVFKSQTGR